MMMFSIIVYVIVRGGRIARRTASTQPTAQKRQEDYIKEVAGSVTPTDQIAKASTMLAAGTISRSEFDTLKAKALV